jgi:hypothetical protein
MVIPSRRTFWHFWARGLVAFFAVGPMVYLCLVWLRRLLDWLFEDVSSPAWKGVDLAIRAALLLFLFPWLIGVGVEETYPRILETLWGRPESEDTPRMNTESRA